MTAHHTVPRNPPDFARIAAISFDVDGVLTDGRIVYLDDGRELKQFHVQDGSAMKLLLEAGIAVALITGRSSPIVERRAAELGITHVYQGQAHKVAAFTDFLARCGIDASAAAHVGDDLPDLAVFERCSLGIAVANAHPALLARAGHITRARGGEGVVRELAEVLLRARGQWPWADTQ